MKNIKVLLVEDHKMVRLGLSLAFSNIDDITALTVNDDYVTEGWIQEIDPSKGGYPAYGPVIDEMNKEANAYLPAPEPTTATLSLLALAGLAARRRRK